MADTLSPQATAGLWAAGIFGWFVLSVLVRRWRGLPLFARPQPGDRFVERWASGRAGGGLMARLSSVRNCLQVRVDDAAIRIHPHFPFTLGFMPELYGMDHFVPLDRVRTAAILGGHRVQAVEVHFRQPDGSDQVLQLLLRRPEGFIEAVLGRRGDAPSPAPEA